MRFWTMQKKRREGVFYCCIWCGTPDAGGGGGTGGVGRLENAPLLARAAAAAAAPEGGVRMPTAQAGLFSCRRKEFGSEGEKGQNEQYC
jgi:hypothetical protein